METSEGMLSSPPKKRVTMIKDLVGRVRSSSYALPDERFVYGKAVVPDTEGAGKVVQSWAQAEPSKPHESMRSFPATNLEALRNGCFTAGTQREFAKNNPVFKTNPKSSVVDRSDIMAADDLAQYTFGIRSEPNEVPIRELLRCSDPSVGEIDYPDRSHRNLKGRLPDAKPTKSSKLFEKHIKHHYGDKQKPSLFKLARFVKVESKVKEMMQ